MVLMERIPNTDTPPSGQDIPPEAGPDPESQDAPRRRGRPPGSKNRNSAGGTPRRASIESRVRGAISSVVAFGNSFMVNEPDPLTDEEMTALTEAATLSALQSQRIIKWLEKTSGPVSHAMLILVLLQISFPRLVRRNLIPFVRMSNDSATTPPLSMAAGGASGDNRGHVLGEDDSGEFSPPVSDVHNFH